MSNEQLIKSAHVWFVAVVLFGVIAFATKAGPRPAHSAPQNANSNTSQNQNQNSAANQNSTANTSGMSSKDQKFLMDAAMGGLMEVELGRWAAQVGTSPEVKQFGQRMIDDHSKANTELAQLATSKGVTVPTQLDEKHQREVSKIARLKGEAFDRAYSKAMLSDHEKDVKEFEKQSTNAADADVKAFASKTLPTLQEHLQMVRALPGNSKPSSSNANANANRNSNN